MSVQNMLVVSGPPIWTVKIADFGICKQTQIDGTSLHTQVGSQYFVAPEVYYQEADNYTNAVDIWSLGAILFLILSGRVMLEDNRHLHDYQQGKKLFPFDLLRRQEVSDAGIEFVRGLLARLPAQRPSASACFQDPWLRGVTEVAVEVAVAAV